MMVWMVCAATTAVLIHTLHQGTFTVTESEPDIDKISEKVKRKISQEKDTGN